MKLNNEKVILLLLSALNFTHILDFMIMMPLSLYLMPSFKISTESFSILVSSYTISSFLSGLLASLFVDRFDRKKVLLLGYIGFLVGTLACGFANTFYFLLAARIVAGLFGGLIAAQVLSIISDLFSYENRGKAVGAVMSSFAIASTFGVPFALWLSKHFGWHAPFLLIVGLGVLLSPFLIKFIPSMTGHIAQKGKEPAALTSIKNAITVPQVRLALFFSFLTTAGHFVIIPFINPYMVHNNHYPESAAQLIYLVGGIAGFLSAIFLGRMADRFGKLKIFVLCMVFSLPLVLSITNASNISLPFMLGLFACWFFTSTGRNITSQAMVTNVVPASQRSGFMSLNSSTQHLAISIAALFSGQIITENADKTLNHYGLLGCISVIILCFSMLLGRYIFKKMDTHSKTPNETLADSEEIFIEAST